MSLVRLEAAGLVETVSGTDALTVFAPTDAAFAALLKELGVTAEQLLAKPDLKASSVLFLELRSCQPQANKHHSLWHMSAYQ